MKSGVPSTSYDNDPTDLPPPTYTESQNTSSNPTPSTSFALDTKEKHNSSGSHASPNIQSLTSQIQSQLNTLLNDIRTTTQQKSLLQTSKGSKLLSLLTPPISSFLTNFATSGLQKGTLILVPASGMKDETALPVDYIFSDNAHEYTKYVRVSDEDSERRIEEFRREKQKFGYGYVAEDENGEGEDLWWWNDEVMAKRLASQLRPVQKAAERELPARPVVNKDIGSSKSSFWSRSKRKEKEVEKVPVTTERKQDKVVMDVEAEEVSFRLENDCGLYESKVGYGIVVRLKVNLAG